MRKQVIKQIIPYLTKEIFLNAVLLPEEWKNRSGSSIIKELRDLGYPISNKDFYNIRRKILKERGWLPDRYLTNPAVNQEKNK